VCDLLQSLRVFLVEVFETFSRVPQVFQWFPGIILRSITLPLDEVLQVFPPFVEAYLQHLCNLVEVNPVYHIQGRRVFVVLIGGYRWNPRTKEYSIEDWVNLPRVGKFKLIGDGSNFTDDREGTIRASNFFVGQWVTKFTPERYTLSLGLWSGSACRLAS
jgi:hypothetical protein